MTHFTFTDPNIETTGTFTVNGCTITAPIFTVEELPDILAVTRRHARRFYDGTHRSFEALTRSYALWSDPRYPLRQKALPILAKITGFSEANIASFGLFPFSLKALDVPYLSQLHQQLAGLIESGAYARFTPWQGGYIKGYGTPRLTLQNRPRQIVHNVAGNVVGPSWLSTMLGAVAQTSQFIKLPSRDLASFMIYLQSLDDIAPEFRKTIACGYYAGGGEIEDHLFREADVVMGLGSSETMDAIARKLARVNPQARLLRHGWSLSFHVVSRAYATAEIAELAAWGVCAHDGNACFSPANIYVEAGGPLSPEQFAEQVAGHLASLAADIPPKASLGVAERVTNYRQTQLQRRLLGENVRVLKSRDTAYTVVVDWEDPRLTPTCQERTVVIKPVSDIWAVPRYAAHLNGHLQTVGVAVPRPDILDMADRLGALGATNVRMLGTEYILDLAECHDGVFNTAQMFMSDNLRWLNISFSDTDAAIADALRLKSRTLAQLGQAAAV